MNMSGLLISSLGALVMTGSALAGQPPDVVQSDGNQNSAMGTDALYYLAAGTQNTAAGYESLLNNAIGGANTAFGVQSVLANTSGYDKGNSA
jgi:hypothetical protein